MALMAGASLTYALLTQDTRRSHDKELPKRARRPLPPIKEPEPRIGPVDPVAPSRLPALGYLPGDTGFVVGLHAQEVLASPAGRDLKKQPLKIGTFELRLEAVKDLVGLPLEDIDHAVLGVSFDPDVPLTPVHVVVRTRADLDSKRLLEKLRAGKPRQETTPQGGKRTVHTVTVQKLQMSLWLADDRTFVIGIFAMKLDRVPEKPAEGIDHLAAPLRQALTQRLSTGMPLWLAGHSEDWSKTVLPDLLKMFKDVPMLTHIDKVKTFAIGVVPDRPLKVHGAFRCPNEAVAKKLEAQELAPRAKKEPEAFQYAREGVWLQAQWKVDLGK
jgi:hypothetical protein